MSDIDLSLHDYPAPQAVHSGTVFVGIPWNGVNTWKAKTTDDGWVALWRNGNLVSYTPWEWWADGPRIARLIEQYST